MQRHITRSPLDGQIPSGFIVDARSPSEHVYDHIPGSINAPVLDDSQRAEVGTLYKQVDPFTARKKGAIYTSRNIANHLETTLVNLSLDTPLWVYCWRGGQRSGSLALVLHEIGFKPTLIEGGYKQWRRDVLKFLPERIAQFDYRVISGPTGSGKTHVLNALDQQGEQVLDLESLCGHKGSLLGLLPNEQQPSQPALESRLYHALSQFDATQPVWVEDESPKLGRLTLPQALMAKINESAHIHLDDTLERRQQRVLDDYKAWFDFPEQLTERLQRLKARHSNAVIDDWVGQIDAAQWPNLVGSLLQHHYDPTYQHRGQRHASGPAYRLDISRHNATEVALALTQLTLS